MWKWVVLGDFNEILCLNEARGGRMRNQWQLENFMRAVEDCRLVDLGFIGYPYTFSNHREGEEEFQARLDRDYPKLMEDFWTKCGNNNDGWSGKLVSCKEMLKSWSRSTFGDLRKKIQSIKQDLDLVKSSPRTAEMVERERSLSEELDRWLVREETLWMQRSRVLWLNQGDKNTKFFHAKANHKRKVNWIAKLQDSHGVVQEDQNKISEIITSYFSTLFQSSLHGSEEEMSNQLGCISPVINEDMNSMLLRDITDEEIKAAVFSLGPLKSPSIDGFPAVFYQRHWESIKDHVVKEVKDFWATGHLDKEINRTLIVLIPKKEALRVEDWRPISLCTVMIKIITKLIVQRLQPLLRQVISIYQSAFVRGRIITDNLVVAHEIAHFIKSRRDDSNYFASFKVDMSKAYDRVEWSFLKQLLCRMGGLRQGDPLSPYLFLLCTEWLNAKIMKAVSRKNITGISICRKAPVISHLFFDSDSIFFLKAERGEAENLQFILRLYENVSGQKINYEKLEICFSKNTPAEVRLSICDVLRVPQVGCHSKYLDLPLLVGQRKSEDWKCRLLSIGGREVLIKAVIQAIPMYMMSVYYFPRKIIAEINKLMLQFWWDKKEGGKGINWVSQNTLQKKKCEGGLGLKDLIIFNEAMLLKIGWRMVKQPELLLSRTLLAKNYGGGVNLWRRGVISDRNCKICGFSEETALHVVADCWWAKALFAKFNLTIPCFQAESGSPSDWLWWSGAVDMTVHLKKGTCSSEVEGQAFLLALKLARSLEVEIASFETDSLEVYRAISSGVGVADWCESWLEAAIDILRLKPSWRLKAISRDANTAADCRFDSNRMKKNQEVDFLPFAEVLKMTSSVWIRQQAGQGAATFEDLHQMGWDVMRCRIRLVLPLD
ncbi:hypothetical protein QQ045_001187 [Rhodiola kirilowii]